MIRTLLCFSAFLALPLAAPAHSSELDGELAGELEYSFIEMPSIDPRYEPVSVSTLQLVGRGVQTRDGSESIALACYDPESAAGKGSCAQLRFVHLLTQSRQAYYVGLPLKISQMTEGHRVAGKSDEKQRKFAVKKVMKEYQKWRKKTRSGSQWDRLLKTADIMAAIFVLGVFLTPATGGAGPIALLSVSPMTILPTLLNRTLYISFEGAKLTQLTLDQNGWNWASDPRRVGRKTFDKFRMFIRSKQ